ncbi:MAG: hypothetical protein ACOY33_06905 [Pseudomonadota bacterium]
MGIMNRLAMAAMLAVATGEGVADDRSLAIDAALALDRLDIETFMMLYDETDRSQAALVRQQLAAAGEPLQKLLPGLRDTESVMGNAEAWRVIQASIVGDRQTRGMIDTGYDARTLAEMRTAIPTLQRALRAQKGLDRPASPEEAALLDASNLFAVYIRLVASPLGGISDNNDESVDQDLPTLVARFDRHLDALLARHAGDAEKRIVLQRIRTKWQFMRVTILKYTQQATPAIVQRHGRDIVDGLRSLI